jgi:hypothetical protein
VLRFGQWKRIWLIPNRAAATQKAVDAARRKAERDALEADEAASLPTKAKTGNAKTAQKKTKGLDLSQLDHSPAAASGSSALAGLNATGIDNALDALSLTAHSTEAVDRHPERRIKAAFTVFEARRLDEMKDDKGLRRNQKVELIRREFEKSPENPMNQVSAKYNSSKEEVKQIQHAERKKTEQRLVGGNNAASLQE